MHAQSIYNSISRDATSTTYTEEELQEGSITHVTWTPDFTSNARVKRTWQSKTNMKIMLIWPTHTTQHIRKKPKSEIRCNACTGQSDMGMAASNTLVYPWRST